ncbi:hypothetical protein ACIBG7_23185 [Nonomuraea sp. NPDC050328]|uniref:hypothetical protein n=1 Tax=Nonomuraea sp. NPDC050328 TaxID=3364361 RepID=UPI0037A5EE56
MPLACREYVSTRCTGDRAADYEILLRMRDHLRALTDRHPDLRFRAAAFSRESELEQELIDPVRALAGTGGVLPLIWLNLTYPAGHVPPEALLELEETFELRLLGEFVDEPVSSADGASASTRPGRTGNPGA